MVGSAIRPWCRWTLLMIATRCFAYRHSDDEVETLGISDNGEERQVNASKHLSTKSTASGADPPKYVRLVGFSLETHTIKSGKHFVYPGKFPIQGNADLRNTKRSDASQRTRMITSVSQDAAQRVEVMVSAMRAAKADVQVADKTLNIFIAPEFFFRSPAYYYPYFAYAGEAVANSTADGVTSPLPLILSELLQESQKPEYKGWLFVCGTIIARDPTAKSKQLSAWMQFNFAPVLLGGTRDAWIIQKQEESRADRLVRRSGKWITPTLGKKAKHFSLAQIEALQSVLGYVVVSATDSPHYGSNHYFRAAGLLLGLEICLDHGRLVKIGSKSAQVQLLPTGGMAIREEREDSTATPILLQDGAAGGVTEYFCPGCKLGTKDFDPPFNSTLDGQIHCSVDRTFGVKTSCKQGPEVKSLGIFATREQLKEVYDSHGGASKLDPNVGTKWSHEGFQTHVFSKTSAVVQLAQSSFSIAGEDLMFQPRLNVGPAIAVPSEAKLLRQIVGEQAAAVAKDRLEKQKTQAMS